MKNTNKEKILSETKQQSIQSKKALKELAMVTRKLEDVNSKLQESESVKSNFLSNIRNEINNPLTSIMGLSKQLTTSSNLNAETTKTLADFIYSEAFQLDFQLRNIFAAAELEAGDTFLGISNVNVGSMVVNSVDTFVHLTAEKDVKIVYGVYPQKEGEAVIFRADMDKLRIILTNLLSNAIEFSHPGGLVEIKVWVEQDNLNISVSDYGIGIAEADQQKIFDRFKQLETGMRKTHSGHGLGLSITKEMLTLMEGSVSVKSEKDKGSTFTITIPDSAPEAKIEGIAVDGNVFVFEEEEQEF